MDTHNDASRHDKARRFLELHRRPGCFLMPNAWDVGSARMLEAAGFAALATTSAGVAFSLGRPDNLFCAPENRVDRDTMLARVAEMARAVGPPLNADLEAGFGVAPETVAETIRRAIAAGAAGANIEDYSGDRAAPLYEIDLATERIRAARAAIDASGVAFVLTARTDAVLVEHPQAFAESVRRVRRFREAGADCLFVPGLGDAASIGRLVKEASGPVNVVMGLVGSALTLADLEALGVRRVSIGGSLARAMYHRIREAAREMFEHGTFRNTEHQIPQGELNQLFERRGDHGTHHHD
jgi:2-methylisocitrate lyase-like PEP mutase family enzyme